MEKPAYSLKYPRKVFIRSGMRFLGRFLMSVLANVEIKGKERLPAKGPIILAGNHVAALEAVMMCIYNPGIVEFLGTGDIPFDPNYALFVKAYGLIPVNRGNLDRKGLLMGMDVLAQNGILGIFPEGGAWDPANMQAQIGIALLSFRSNTPILPIGFGGVKDGLGKALRLKHPTLVMNVGKIIPPVSIKKEIINLKSNLEESAGLILDRINALVPEKDLRFYQRRVNEVYSLDITITDQDHIIEIPGEFMVTHGLTYARFLYSPVVMDVLARNLRLPIRPIKQVNSENSLHPLLNAWGAILDYLEINPGYFTYRFGMVEGLAMKKALKELLRLGEWVHQSGYALTIQPVRHYRNAETGASVTERGGCFPNSL
jgi:1-acyl-sn-glycerol-3-phosphate acyltransferase